ncbi:alanine racemase [Plantactinospora sp. WMMB334]|uniref:alanine racemase n=1 Tax=Plantactinospora sp. WMMB334 TaxID=3404119 RepID=UPI003B9499C8
MTAYDVPLPAPLTALPTPALLVDEERMTRNIADAAGRAARTGVALRPHFKTSKCLEIARAQLAAGAIGFTCSTPAEVTALQEAGLGDLLWAHAPVGPAKVAFAVRAAVGQRRRTDRPESGDRPYAGDGLTVALDSTAVAVPLSEAAAAAGVILPYLIEVDTGHGRAGVPPEEVAALAAELARLPGLHLRGIFTHEGHLARHVGDRAALEAAGRRAGETMADLAAALRTAGHPCRVVSVGSTPGATSTPEVPGVTEARAGSYVFFDANQVALGSADPERCALTVLSRVTRVRADGTVIIDAGVKAMSSDGSVAGNGFGVVTPDIDFGTANEEHGFLTGPGTTGLRVGDLVRIVPNHVCGTVNMWSGMYLVDGETAVRRWAVVARH